MLVADEIAHRCDEARIERPFFQYGIEVCERLETMHDVGVAFPLDHDQVLVVRFERVAADVIALATALLNEAVYQRFACRCDVGDFIRGEHVLAHHVAVLLEALQFIGGEPAARSAVFCGIDHVVSL